jgi:hypothetical protein
MSNKSVVKMVQQHKVVQDNRLRSPVQPHSNYCETHSHHYYLWNTHTTYRSLTSLLSYRKNDPMVVLHTKPQGAPQRNNTHQTLELTFDASCILDPNTLYGFTIVLIWVFDIPVGPMNVTSSMKPLYTLLNPQTPMIIRAMLFEHIFIDKKIQHLKSKQTEMVCYWITF